MLRVCATRLTTTATRQIVPSLHHSITKRRLQSSVVVMSGTGEPAKVGGSQIKTQTQDDQPGHEHQMQGTKPVYIRDTYKGSGKLQNKVAIITGGDSGIGRAVAVHYAREGADVAIVYLSEHKDAQETEELVKKEGRKCLLFAADVGDPKVVARAMTPPLSSTHSA